MKKRRYWISTWDSNKQEFTPHRGVRTGPYTLFGLRKAMRALEAQGYTARKGDPSVLVEGDYRP